MDGSHRQVLLTGVAYAFAIEVFRGSVFWSDWERRTLEKTDIAHNHNRTLLIQTKERPSDLHIYHPERQPKCKWCFDIGKYWFIKI